MRRIWAFLSIGMLSLPLIASAFDNGMTHPDISERALDASTVDTHLKANLGLVEGTETILGPNSNGKPPREPDQTVLGWIREGSYSEDVPVCRASNHFHNPLRDWTESGLRDQPWFVNRHCTPTEYPPWSIWSAIPWATSYTQPSPAGAKEQTTNQWNWDRAREYFSIYLTGKNYENQLVAATQSARDSYLASSFQALGQVLHLLQDMAVPAHVRDDFRSHLAWNGITPSTIFKPNEWVTERFEHFVKKEGIISGEPVRPNLQNPSLTAFWDTNQYTGQDPDLLSSQTLGLSEYTNINFPSKDTIFSEDFLNDSDPSNDVYHHPYPRKGSVNIMDYVNYVMLPQTVTAEDGQSDTRFYIAKVYDGEIVDRFVAATYFTRNIQDCTGYTSSVFYKTLTIDDECARNHAQKLVPRAIGYSAALLDYFFRGKIEITDVQFGYNPARVIDTIIFSVRNVTEDAEAMTNGAIDVVIKHKNVYEQEYHHTVARIVGASSIPREEPAEFVVELSEPIPIETADAQLFVVFKGMLGLENGGIGVGFKDDAIGTLFAEEWDNGLTGNHSWQHESSCSESGAGEAGNTVSDGILWKGNLRYVGWSSACVNESYLSLVDEANPYGILIRPDTFVHFRIPTMYINQIPPAPPGMTTNWQAFNLMFNDGFMIQYSPQEDQMMSFPNTAYFTFTPSSMIVGNIYHLFEQGELTIPEPLYLETIDFIQQLMALDPEHPSTVEHEQAMEVDYIRIVGGK